MELVKWTSDVEFTLGGTSFLASPWAGLISSTERFLLAKERGLVEFYVGLIASLAPRSVLEFGVFQGGSTAFLAAFAKPERLVAIELDPDPAVALEEWVTDRRLGSVVETHYGVDQGDSLTVRDIVETAFREKAIDLVIDDASHCYAPSLASFNTVFPYVRPGGMYVIEDWALVHVGIAWGSPGELPLSVLGFQLQMAAGSRGGAIDSVEINQYAITVQRGDAPLDPGTFDIGRCYNDDSRQLIPGLPDSQ
jgi:SAM-dependent methyltransferase